MPVLLHVDSSPMGDLSISRRLTREFVDRWREANPGGKILSRDLALLNIPPIDAEYVEANYTMKEYRTNRQNDILALATEFARELLDADEYVIGVPMHNWGPSSHFKLWTDKIVLFGETVQMTLTGAVGALEGKRAAFIIATGRNFGPGSGNESRNHIVPWIRTFFGNLGVQNMTFVLADGTSGIRNGRISRQDFLGPHIDNVRALFAKSL